MKTNSRSDLDFIQGLGFGGLIGTLIGVSITTWAVSTASKVKPQETCQVMEKSASSLNITCHNLSMPSKSK
jgi:hypothetical protein